MYFIWYLASEDTTKCAIILAPNFSYYLIHRPPIQSFIWKNLQWYTILHIDTKFKEPTVEYHKFRPSSWALLGVAYSKASIQQIHPDTIAMEREYLKFIHQVLRINPHLDVIALHSQKLWINRLMQTWLLVTKNSSDFIKVKKQDDFTWISLRFTVSRESSL